jgi:signal transduction histidine kinase
MDVWASVKRNVANVLIVSVAAASLVEISVSVIPDSKLALATMSAASLGALLARRRFPFGGPLACTAVMAAGSFVAGPGLRVLAVPILTAMLAGWLMGYGNDRRRAVIGLFLQYACVQIVTANFGEPGAGDVVFTSLLIGAPWLAGHTVRARAEVGRRLEERTRQLETAREEAAHSAVADERRRIARELHDVVAHSISVMTIQAGAARLLLDGDPERAEEPLLRVEETGRETLTEMRRLLGFLRRDMAPERLEARPSLEHIGSLLEQYREAGLPVELTVKGNERTLPPGLDLAAYRVVQEALTNTLKHAAGAQAVVTVAYDAESLELAVSDDGKGGQAPRRASGAGGGHGLVGMRERAAIYGGRLDAGPSPNGGFTVSARFPLEPSTG